MLLYYIIVDCDSGMNNNLSILFTNNLPREE